MIQPLSFGIGLEADRHRPTSDVALKVFRLNMKQILEGVQRVLLALHKLIQRCVSCERIADYMNI